MCTSRCQCRRRRRRPPRRGHAGGVAWRSDQSRLSVGRHAALRSGPGHEFDSIKCALPAGPGTLGPCPAPARLRPGAARSAAAMASVRAVSAARLRLSAVGGQAALESEAAACQGPGAIKAAVAAKALPSSATGVHAPRSPFVLKRIRVVGQVYTRQAGGSQLCSAAGNARQGGRPGRCRRQGAAGDSGRPIAGPRATRKPLLASAREHQDERPGPPLFHSRLSSGSTAVGRLDARRRGVARRRRRLSGGGADPPRGPLTKDGAR